MELEPLFSSRILVRPSLQRPRVFQMKKSRSDFLYCKTGLAVLRGCENCISAFASGLWSVAPSNPMFTVNGYFDQYSQQYKQNPSAVALEVGDPL